MPVPTAQDILSLNDESIAGFIQTQAKERQLSLIMRNLNRDMLGADAEARALAAQALERLGFPNDI